VSSGGKACVRQLERPLDTPGDEAIAGTRGEDAPVEEKNLLERMLEAQNLRRALHQVRRNQGCPRSRRDDRGRPGRVPEDTLADDPSRLTGGHLVHLHRSSYAIGSPVVYLNYETTSLYSTLDQR
jgi:hypothetical protein